VLIAGQEPALVTPLRQVQALTESKNGPSATTIGTYLTLRNEGNLPLNYSDLRVRYYFTAEGTQPLNFYLDFTGLGAGSPTGQLVRMSTPVANADTYLELRFTNGGQLAPLSNTGPLRYRITKADGGRFDQRNDYSYQEQPASLSLNSRVVVYVGQERIWGQEPGGSARIGQAEPSAELVVKVLGNPVVGSQLEVEVRGAEGQPLQLQLSDGSGRVISRQTVEQAGAVQTQRLEVGSQGPGLLLLQVSSPTQSQVVKVLKL
jgi:hypothetical protein